MSTNIVNKDTGELVTLANGTRMWIGTKTAHDLAVQQGTMPNNCMVCITDDAAGEEAWQYSTSETRTGKTWIDGKPIYRIVFSFTGTGEITGAVVQNMAVLVNSTDVCTFTTGGKSCSYYNGEIDYWNWYLTNANQLVVRCGSGLTIVHGFVILEYTKTTD